jgi:DNA-binding transcriptional MerR regulator
LYTVKQVSTLAGVSVRTLHYYDEIGLLKPSRIAANGYRYYDDNALLRLQQVLFYREIGLELIQISEILNRPDFDLVKALDSHRAALEDKITRLHSLIDTVDSTINYLTGGEAMSKKRLFEPFSDEKQKEYERSARLQYGPKLVNESIQRWNGYSQAEKDRIMNEGSQIYIELAAAVEAGIPAHSAEIRAIVQRWHHHIRHFYEPTLDILRGLGEAYKSNPDFSANFVKLHPDLPAYLEEAITDYVNDLETAEIERMLAEDEEKSAGQK